MEDNFLSKQYSNTIPSGVITCQAPSNIALVKYWGKYDVQMPKNTSISFTLSKCVTKTKLTFEKKSSKGLDFSVFLDGVETPSFVPKIEAFFNRIVNYVPFIEAYSFRIDTQNTFPHSSGIASSASGMAALASCIIEIEKQLVTDVYSNDFWLQKTSFLARLGSGSACRSLEGPIVIWGAHSDIPNSSQLYGIKMTSPLHSVFTNYNDTILLIDKGTKTVSSTVGHNLMHDHPFAEQRFNQANINCRSLIKILEDGDQDAFIHLVELEALTLHGMMLTSSPYFMLFKPNTVAAINEIWAYRKHTNSKLCFTLDAGANVHVLYPETETEQVQQFIQEKLSVYCQQEQYIHDKVGIGAKLLD